MKNSSIQLVLGDTQQEVAHLHTIVTQAIEAKSSLFLGRFLTDLSVSDMQQILWSHFRVVLHQYGLSRYVNASPIMADVRRIEIGLEEAKVALQSGNYGTVFLSQVLDILDDPMFTTEDIMALVDARPENVMLILTGHKVPNELLQKCECSLLDIRPNDTSFCQEKAR